MNFDDASLKAAVRRVWGRETPPGLRARVERMIRAERQAEWGVRTVVPCRWPGKDDLLPEPLALDDRAGCVSLVSPS